MLLFIRALLLSLTSAFGLSAAACNCDKYTGIDSLAQMSEYALVARVRILETRVLPRPAPDGELSGAVHKVAYLDLFKGSADSVIYDPGRNTSCEMGIEPGEEWLFFAYRVNGRLIVSACNRDVELRTAGGWRTWYEEGSGLYALNAVLRIFGRPVTEPTNGPFVDRYPDGNPEREGSYKNGKKDGCWRYWYPDSTLYGIEQYANGIRHGIERWYFPSGQLQCLCEYKDGKNIGAHQQFQDTTVYKKIRPEFYFRYGGTLESVRAAFSSPSVAYEEIFGDTGQLLVHRIFYQSGGVFRESCFGRRPGHYFETNSHENGFVSSAGYVYLGNPVGVMVFFDERGKEIRRITGDGKTPLYRLAPDLETPLFPEVKRKRRT